MKSDGLNQIGKGIRRTNKDVDYALKRYSENFPKIESTRDAFDVSTDFIAFFRTERDDNRVLLDLVFLLPLCPDCEQGS